MFIVYDTSQSCFQNSSTESVRAGGVFTTKTKMWYSTLRKNHVEAPQASKIQKCTLMMTSYWGNVSSPISLFIEWLLLRMSHIWRLVCSEDWNTECHLPVRAIVTVSSHKVTLSAPNLTSHTKSTIFVWHNPLKRWGCCRVRCNNAELLTLSRVQIACFRK